MTVVNDERWHEFDLAPEQQEAFQEKLADAGFKVHRVLNRVPYDKDGSPIDGPRVREILASVKKEQVDMPVPSAPKAPVKAAKTEPKAAGKTKKKK